MSADHITVRASLYEYLHIADADVPSMLREYVIERFGARRGYISRAAAHYGLCRQGMHGRLRGDLALTVSMLDDLDLFHRLVKMRDEMFGERLLTSADVSAMIRANVYSHFGKLAAAAAHYGISEPSLCHMCRRGSGYYRFVNRSQKQRQLLADIGVVYGYFRPIPL